MAKRHTMFSNFVRNVDRLGFVVKEARELSMALAVLATFGDDVAIEALLDLHREYGNDTQEWHDRLRSIIQDTRKGMTERFSRGQIRYLKQKLREEGILSSCRV